MFLGTFTPRLDDKGRLILPARFREESARIDGTERLVITKGQERCLSVWPAAAFAEAADRIRRAPVVGSLASPRAVRDYLRVLYAGASEQSFDKQGRVSLPPALREYAGLTSQVAVVGADTHFELWDAAAWDRYVAEKEPAFADLDQDDLFRGASPEPP
jgi:MraZ protein